MKQAIIVFQKNPKEGHTKTRLAATVGHPNAMRVYSELVRHAHSVVRLFSCKKYIYFSDFVEEDNRWSDYECRVQSKDDLGSRMKNALDEVLNEGVDSAILIGTDCYHLTETIIAEALSSLLSSDYCIGPALDGGYYLIGTNKTDDEVFLNKEWSTETVFKEAQESIQRIKKNIFILPSLSDVDTEADLGELRKFLIE
ncbi:MAG: TIGR04282 family arsenosugar biosynthesis glycosyltransferase [Bacteroidetes bacterium]|nr:TIGR04282 family arsenosugar biosynthesis glycosyltransferase [Bacteroidota bacterium]